MRVDLPGPAPRVAFVGGPRHRLHAPLSNDWAECQFFLTGGSAVNALVDSVTRWRAEITVVFAPNELSFEIARALPGMKLGILDAPLISAEERGRLARLQEDCGFSAFTCVSEPTDDEGRPHFQQVLPLPIDTSLFAAGPRLDRWSVLIPEWACLPAPLLAELRQRHPVTVLPSQSDPNAILAAVREHGVLVYSAYDVMGRFDPLPLLALAAGLLLVGDRPFPGRWGIEPDDEYLIREGSQLVWALDEAVAQRQATQAIRVRAWQKSREAFAASAAFKRLIHDALLLADPRAHLARASAANALRSGPVAVVPGRKRKAAGS